MTCALLLPLALTSQVSFGQEQEAMEEVLVTGSYIRGSATDAPSPVQVLQRETIEQQGARDVWDVVKNLQVNQGSTTNDNAAAENATISGTSNVNLRNLGQNSTLTLLNGKRQVAAAALTADGSEFVDLNAIPQIMIDRVEVLTDGGSALYGSDAIAGVVNVMLRTQFEGLEVSGRYQQIDGGSEPADSTMGAIWGTSFNEGATHLVFGAEYVKRDPVRLIDAPHYDPSRTIFTGEMQSVAAIIGAPANPAWVNAANRQLRIDRGLPPVGEYTDPNCLAAGGFIGDPKTQGFDDPDSSCREDTTKYALVNVGEERKNASLAFSHAFSDGAEVYSFFQYAHNDIERPDDGATASLGPAVLLPVGSPVNGLGSRSGTVTPASQVPNAPNLVANGGIGSVALVDYVFGLPRQGGIDNLNEAETYGGQVGLRGDFGIGEREFSYDVSYSYSKSQILRKDRTIVRDRAELAINGLGGPNCTPNGTTTYNLNADPYFGIPQLEPVFFGFYAPRYPQNIRETISLAVTSTNHGQGGCMFLNPFMSGLVNPALANSPELIDWLMPVVPTSDRENELDVIDAVVSGDLFTLPGGKSAFALGLQWREQHNIGRSYSLVEPPPLTIVGYDANGVPNQFEEYSNDNNYGGFFTNSFDDTRDIKAVFAEVSLPFVESLETQLAVRYEDYGGGIGSEVSPKVALRWQAIDPLAFRASYSQSFRAPNTGIVFNGAGADAASVRDRLASQEVRAGLADPTFDNAEDEGLFTRSLASPDLKSETADTYNFGVIFQPRGVLNGLTMTIDYWRFELEGRVVAQPLVDALEPELALFLEARANPANYVLNSSLPFNSPQRFVPCDPNTLTGAARLDCVVDPRTYEIVGIDRGEEDAQLITVDTRSVNAGRVETDGVDLRLNYTWNMGAGRFFAGIDFTYVNKYEISDLPGFEQGFFGTGITDAAGTTGDGILVRSQPDKKGNLHLTWANDAHAITGIARYIGSYDDLAYDTVIANALPQVIALASRTVDSYTSFDLQYTYTKDWGGNWGSTRFTLGALNVTDEAAPFREYGAFDYDSTVVDPKGRRFYVQLTHDF